MTPNLITNQAIHNNIFAEQNITNENSSLQKYLPVEIWEKIIKFCDIKTTSILSMLCKSNYVMVTPLLHRKILQLNYQQKVPCNCLLYSIEGYKSFIAPIIENINIEVKHEIDGFLEQNKKRSDIKQLFSAFVFKKLESIITKNNTTKVLEIDLFQGIDKFNINSQSNHCAITLKKAKNIIYICKINFPLAIEVVTKIDFLQKDQYIVSIQFTPENNLLVVAENILEEESLEEFLYRDSDLGIVYLCLFSLNLNSNNSIDPKQLWKCVIKNKGGYKKAIIIPQSNDEEIILITQHYRCVMRRDEESWLLKIKDTGIDIQRFTLNNETLSPYTEIANLIFSNSGTELAAIVPSDKPGLIPTDSMLHMFSRKSIQNVFKEEQLPENCYEIKTDFTRGIDSYHPLKFNKSGNICIFLNGRSLIMLNKIDSKWCIAMELSRGCYEDLELSLDEKNIHAVYSQDENSKISLHVIPIEDKILKSKNSPICIQEHQEKFPPSYKSYYTLYEDINFDRFTMHLSSLAIFIQDKREDVVKMIIPQNDERNKSFHEKISYYAGKLKGLILKKNISEGN